MNRIKETEPENLKKLYSFFENAPLPYQSLNKDGNIIQVNSAWCKTLGYTKKEVIGKWFGDYVSANSIDKFRKNFPKLKKSGKIKSEIELLTKKGNILIFTIDASVRYNSNGEFIHTHCILTNITEQRKKELELQESEEKFRTFFENAPIGLSITTIDGNVNANREFARMLGYSIEELNELNWREVTFKDDVEKNEKLLNEYICGKNKSLNLGKRYIRKDGSLCWASLTVIARKDEEGKPLYYISTILDISEKKRAENQLLDERDKANMYFDSAGTMFVALDLKGIVTKVNKTTCDILEVNKNEIIGKNWFENYIPENWKKNVQQVGENLLKGDITKYGVFENPVLTSKGKERFIAWKSVLLYDENNEISGFLSSGLDLTEKKEAERRANIHFARLQSLFKNTPVIISIFNEDGSYIDVSDSFLKLLNLSNENIIGKTFHDLLPLDVANKFMKSIETIKETGQPVEENMVLPTSEGNRTFHCERFPILSQEDQIPIFGCIGIEITEKIKISAALRESEAKYSSYIENAPNGIFIADEEGKYIEVNQAASEITGYNKCELLSMSVLDITPEEDHYKAISSFESLFKKGITKNELRFKHKDGSLRWWSVQGVNLGDRVLGFTEDITEKVEQKEELIYISYHDQLTGLFNRRYFEEQIQRIEKKDHPVILIMADINGLKLLNDSFGHEAGDKALKLTADLLMKVCRKKDIVARLGGDEFIIIMKNTETARAESIIKQAVKAADKLEIFGIPISISFGYHQKVFDDESIFDTFAEAENFMYRHKIYESASMHSKAIDVVLKTLFEKSPRELQHSERVSKYCAIIAENLKLDKYRVGQLKTAGLLHDIGKIGIRESILNKEGALCEDEWLEMKKHPESGWRILSTSKEFSKLAFFIREHHENWDGSGYPLGLEGENISLEARIISVADAYDAMTSKRTYRKSLNKEEAIRELESCKGTQFDPKVVDAFVKMISK